VIRIESRLEDSSGSVWGGHIPVRTEEVKALLEGDKRVICTVNGSVRYHAALLGDGMGAYFVLLNKARARKLALRIGDPVVIELEKDNSKYGMDMPEEFEVLLEQDEEGAKYFDKLTPGKKRNLIHIVGSVKSSDIRLRKAVTILNYLKQCEAEIDFKELNQALKVNR
jgi:hypothetical protein